MKPPRQTIIVRQRNFSRTDDEVFIVRIGDTQSLLCLNDVIELKEWCEHAIKNAEPPGLDLAAELAAMQAENDGVSLEDEYRMTGGES